MENALSTSGDQPLTVSQLNRSAKQLLNEHFMHLRVEGELSNLSQPASGHIYFSLKDSRAQVRCAMFKGQRRKLKFAVSDGLQVIVSAQVSLYEPRGDYQLIVDNIQESGDGALQKAFDQLKQKLHKEGLFDDQHKYPPPVLPTQIGIITSSTGAALHDIRTVLQRRFPAIPVIVYPTQVQGEKATQEIIHAIQMANDRNEVDVLILARGGGSLEDLWCFNEERVARAIFSSELPIISGIGHEVDFTIADFVADLRAPTPSAAAEHAVPLQHDWLQHFMQREQFLHQMMLKRFELGKKSLDWLQHRLKQNHPGQQLQRNAQRLDELENRLTGHWKHRFLRDTARLQQSHSQLMLLTPVTRLKQQQQSLAFLEQRILQALRNKLKILNRKQHAIMQTLHAVSPLATLKRGYAIVCPLQSDTIIKSSSELAVDDLTETRFGNGSVISQIKEIKDEN